MKNTVLSTNWFPDCRASANHAALVDCAYDDFDRQAERLAGHDQSYLQLTPGAFEGRFLSGFLGPNASVHVEHCNQSLEQFIGASPTDFSFGLTLGGSEPFVVNGRPFGTGQVMVVAPGASLHMRSPLDGAVVAIVVNRERLLREPGLSPAVFEWLDALVPSVGLLHAPRLAERMRDDAREALQAASAGDAPLLDAERIGNALVGSVAAALSLGRTLETNPEAVSEPRFFERFMESRQQIRAGWHDTVPINALAESLNTTTRSLQDAFSRQVAVGPLTYWRIYRLHLARRALQRSETDNQPIGDIAALHGFWNWSEFSRLYRRQFGERPSETRARGQHAPGQTV